MDERKSSENLLPHFFHLLFPVGVCVLLGAAEEGVRVGVYDGALVGDLVGGYVYLVGRAVG